MLDIKVGDIIHLMNSSIVIEIIKNVALKLDTFVAPRVSEIQSKIGDADRLS